MQEEEREPELERRGSKHALVDPGWNAKDSSLSIGDPVTALVDPSPNVKDLSLDIGILRSAYMDPGLGAGAST